MVLQRKLNMQQNFSEFRVYKTKMEARIKMRRGGGMCVGHEEDIRV